MEAASEANTGEQAQAPVPTLAVRRSPSPVSLRPSLSPRSENIWNARDKIKKELFAGWDAWAQTKAASDEKRIVAVRIMKKWVNAEQPDEALNLNSLNLKSLPDHLPADLRILNVSNNQFKELPENLPATLHTLNARHNRLRSLPQNLPASLRHLDISGNGLASWPGRDAANDVKGRPAYGHSLSARNNPLSREPVNLPADLQSLNVSDNQFSSLPDNLPANLRILAASRNHLRSLPEKLPAGLRTLDARHNRLNSLPEHLPGSLCNINVSFNKLEKWPARFPVNLSTLDAYRNNLSSLPENLPTNLHSLYVDDNLLMSFPEKLPANLHALRIAHNLLTSLPDDLPVNLRHLDVDDNLLTSLPETLPAGLRILEVNNNRLSSLPQHLPATLQKLKVSDNDLRSLPETLPAQLHTIEANDNQLTSLPRHLPAASLTLHAIRNPLRSLPEDILTLSGDCTLSIDATHLSEAVRNRLTAAMNAPGYRNVQINYHIGNPRDNKARPLQEETAIWANAARNVKIIKWSAFQEEQYASQFSTFLSRLRETGEYLAIATRSDFQQRVANLLQQLQDNSELRGTCFNLAHDAIDTCGDRVASRMLDMETVCLDKRMEIDIARGKFDKNPQAVMDHCKAQYRRQKLNDAASAKIKMLNFCDEIEISLGFIVAFSLEFNLNAQMNTMLYGACSNIDPLDVYEIRMALTNQDFTEKTKEFYRPFFKKLGNQAFIEELDNLPPYGKLRSEIKQENRLFHQFLTNSIPMELLLKREGGIHQKLLPNEVSQEIEKEQYLIRSQLENLDPENPQYVQQCKMLQQQYNSVPEEVSVRIKQPLLRRFCAINNVDANLS